MVGSGVLGSALGTVCFTQALALLNPSLANLLLNVQPVISVARLVVLAARAAHAALLPLGGGGARVRRDHGVEPGRAREPAPARRSAWCSSRRPRSAGARRRRSGARPWWRSTSRRARRSATSSARWPRSRSLRSTAISARACGGASFWLRRRSPQMAGLLVVAAITPTFLYFAGLARTRASVATFAEMAQTFASLVITWGVMGDPLLLAPGRGRSRAPRRGGVHQPLRRGWLAAAGDSGDGRVDEVAAARRWGVRLPGARGDVAAHADRIRLGVGGP